MSSAVDSVVCNLHPAPVLAAWLQLPVTITITMVQYTHTSHMQGDTVVPGVLSRAEWMKFLGLFFNMDAESSEIFAAINESYYQTVADVEVCAEMPSFLLATGRIA